MERSVIYSEVVHMVRRPGVGSSSLQSNSHALFTRRLTTVSDFVKPLCSARAVCPRARDCFGRDEGSPRLIGNIAVICLKMKLDIVGGSGMRKPLIADEASISYDVHLLFRRSQVAQAANRNVGRCLKRA